MKKWIWIVSIALAAAAIIFLTDVKGTAVNHVLRNEEALSAFAETYLECPEESTQYGSWKVDCGNTDGVVQFRVRYIGFGSQSDEWGFYYSPENRYVALGNGPESVPLRSGVQFSGEGDNYTYVEKITDHWYWYEIHW